MESGTERLSPIGMHEKAGFLKPLEVGPLFGYFNSTTKKYRVYLTTILNTVNFPLIQVEAPFFRLLLQTSN